MFHMADFGRIALCGAIADYDATTPPPGPRNLTMAVTKRLKIEGFIVTDHSDAAGEFYRTVGPWLASGEIAYRETYADGIDAGGRGLPRARHRGQHRQDAGSSLSRRPGRLLTRLAG